MMKRMVDASMWANEKFGELPMVARLLLIGMITIADDQGRLKANAAWLRAQIFPYDDLGSDDIGNSLCLIADNETIKLYEVEGKRYAQLLNWWEYQSLQYAQPSRYPRPEGWQDRIRYNYSRGVILCNNWTLADGSRGKDTCDENGTPISAESVKNKQNPPGNPPGIPGEGTNKDKEEDKDQDHDLKRESDLVYPPDPAPTFEEPVLAADGETQTEEHEIPVQGDSQPDPVSEEAVQEEVQAVGIDPQTLELSRRWSKNSPKPVKVRMNAQQAAIVAAEPPPDEKPIVKAADKLPPTVSPNRVISLPNGEQAIIASSEWTGMVGAMLDGLGLRELADANVVWAKRKATDTLETAVKVSPMFRDKAGIENLFVCWKKARPNAASNPKEEWILEFAANLAGGRVRYPGGKNEESGRNKPGNSATAGDGNVPERTEAFDYWEWKKEIAAGKYANEPY